MLTIEYDVVLSELQMIYKIQPGIERKETRRKEEEQCLVTLLGNGCARWRRSPEAWPERRRSVEEGGIGRRRRRSGGGGAGRQRGESSSLSLSQSTRLGQG